VVFNEVPVQLFTSKTLLVRNIGDMVAKFKISADSPFKVSPTQGSLETNETMQITVDFFPKVQLF
jgi:hypothetical protein